MKSDTIVDYFDFSDKFDIRVDQEGIVFRMNMEEIGYEWRKSYLSECVTKETIRELIQFLQKHLEDE